MTTALFSILRRHSLSIHTRLMMLTLATVLPLVAASQSGDNTDSRPEDKGCARRSEDSRRSLEDIDRQIIAIEAELQLLAVSPSLRSETYIPFIRR